MKTPLRIKTTTDLASEGQIRVRFYTVSGAHQAGLNIKIATTPQYWLHYCTPDSFRDFPTDTDLPSPDERTWVITITRTSEIRIIVHCNGQEVLNLQLSNSVCTGTRSDWSILWNKDYDSISFPNGDAAFYFQFPPGKYIIFLEFSCCQQGRIHCPVIWLGLLDLLGHAIKCIQSLTSPIGPVDLNFVFIFVTPVLRCNSYTEGLPGGL